MPDVDAAAFEFLLTPPGQRLLAEAMSYDGSDPLALSVRLRRAEGAYEPEQVAAAITQAVLRRAAAGKFGEDARRMYFTQAGLEQATNPLVAAHRAGRAGGDGAGNLLDIGCGIGSDLAAFARAGFRVTGLDRDRVTALVAAANLETLGLPGTVRQDEADGSDWRAYDVVFADPSRRRGSTRILDPKAFSPGWDFVQTLLSTGAADANPSVVIKLAPGIDHALIPPAAEAEWVSLDGGAEGGRALVTLAPGRRAGSCCEACVGASARDPVDVRRPHRLPHGPGWSDRAGCRRRRRRVRLRAGPRGHPRAPGSGCRLQRAGMAARPTHRLCVVRP